MRKFALGGLVTSVMLMFAALAQAEHEPTINILDGNCSVFDAAGNLWTVFGLHINTSNNPDGSTSLHCNASLPEGAILPGMFDPRTGTTLPNKPVVWDAESAAVDTAAVPQADGLVHCAIGNLDTIDWYNTITKGGHSNLSCSFN